MQVLEDLAKDASTLDPLAIRMMPRDVTTRWNSTYDMLVFALKYRSAIDEISGDREMRKYELEKDEWDLVRQLCDVLEVSLSLVFSFLSIIFPQLFKDATLFFSRSTPNLATVIPAMDHIDTHLATASKNLKFSPAIRASLALGKAHLNKYYGMTDHSEVYRIAMSEFLILLFYLFQSFIISFNSLASTTQTSIFPRRQLG
jgi:hypothetical protein